jgi:hypothetical protein
MSRAHFPMSDSGAGGSSPSDNGSRACVKHFPRLRGWRNAGKKGIVPCFKPDPE